MASAIPSIIPLPWTPKQIIESVLSAFIFKILGLIIDAFGELRDQQEQVREDMEVCSTPCDPTVAHSKWVFQAISCAIT